MHYFCDVCEKTINIKSERKHLQSITHNALGKCIWTKHTIKILDFSDKDELFNNYITNQNKKFDSNLVKYDFQFSSDGAFYPHIRSDLRIGQSKIHSKKISLHWIEYFIRTGHPFSHIYEMNIMTISNKKYITHEFYIKQPMQMVELKMNIIIDFNPHLLNRFDRSVKHLSNRKYSNIPLN